MIKPKLTVLSLRYSTWSIRPWLALNHAGVDFQTETVDLDRLAGERSDTADWASVDLATRRKAGSVSGLFPVLWLGDHPIHESLAICEWAHEQNPEAQLWPQDGLHRAWARAISCEVLSGFSALRVEMACHAAARVPTPPLSPEALQQVQRVLEIWERCLSDSGGPFLFGQFTIADCMYFPVLLRFRTYSVQLPDSLEAYGRALEQAPAVRAWARLARNAPAIPKYDQYIRELGGNPSAVPELLPPEN